MSEVTKLTIICFILAILWGFSCLCIYACVREQKKSPLRPNKYKRHSETYVKIFKKHFINSPTIQTVEQKIREMLHIDFTLLTINHADAEKVEFHFGYFDNEISNKMRVVFTITRTYNDIYECATISNLVDDIIIDLQGRILSMYFDQLNG